MEHLRLWDDWVRFVLDEDEDLSMTQRRELALPKFIEYCQKFSTEFIIY